MEWILSLLLVCLIALVIILKRSKGPNPEEQDEPETEESSERIVYMKDHVPIWKKKVK
jgi:hypothetical protein